MHAASHADLVRTVVQTAEALGLEASTSCRRGRRIWGAERVIDVLLYHPRTHERVGVECRYDGGSGEEAERVLMLRADVQTWAMRGVIVTAGKGFDPYMGLLRGQGLVIKLHEFEELLPFYFGANLPVKPSPTESDTLALPRARPPSS